MQVRPEHLSTIALQPAACKQGWRPERKRKSMRTGHMQTVPVVMLTPSPVVHGDNVRLLTQCVSCAQLRCMWQDAVYSPGPLQHDTTYNDSINVCTTTPTTSLRTVRTLTKQQGPRTEAPTASPTPAVVWCLSRHTPASLNLLLRLATLGMRHLHVYPTAL